MISEHLFAARLSHLLNPLLGTATNHRLPKCGRLDMIKARAGHIDQDWLACVRDTSLKLNLLPA